MLLKLRPEQVKNTGARGTHKGKKVKFNMIVQVDENTFDSALLKLKEAKGVVAFEFHGNETHLRTLSDLGPKPIIVHKTVEKLDMNLDFLIGGIDPRVRLVLHLPHDYTNMRAIHTYCAKYPNLRVEGGHLLRLTGCNIGAFSEIDKEDLANKSASKAKLTVDQEYSIQPTIDINDLEEEPEFYELKAAKGATPRVRTPKAPTRPKAEKDKTKTKAPKTPKTPKATAPKVSKQKKALASLFDLSPEKKDPFSNF